MLKRKMKRSIAIGLMAPLITFAFDGGEPEPQSAWWLRATGERACWA